MHESRYRCAPLGARSTRRCWAPHATYPTAYSTYPAFSPWTHGRRFVAQERPCLPLSFVDWDALVSVEKSQRLGRNKAPPAQPPKPASCFKRRLKRALQQSRKLCHACWHRPLLFAVRSRILHHNRTQLRSIDPLPNICVPLRTLTCNLAMVATRPVASQGYGSNASEYGTVVCTPVRWQTREAPQGAGRRQQVERSVPSTTRVRRRWGQASHNHSANYDRHLEAHSQCLHRLDSL
jgi:hypothetical protein